MTMTMLLRGAGCAALLTALSGGILTAGATLDDFYYTYAEIHQELMGLVSQYPDWIRLDSLGYSYETMTPIWGVKISDNVQVEEDEPALWVNGQCHAEEILGINISMEFIRRLVTLGSVGHPQWGPIVQSMEIHVVPSNNPDGLGVVMSELDVTYRKNLHSLEADGHCQIAQGIGADSCGVDLNRNYPAWWNHGDTLWVQNGDAEQFDYFRGPHALSEPECASIARQTERERFVAAVAYHSARTSTNHEIIIYPWSWEGAYNCPTPDFNMMDAVSGGMAAVIDGFNFHPYRNVAGDGRKGNHHNWIYRSYGAVGLLIEVGTQGATGMQPQNQATINFIVSENLDGLNWLCRRIIGYEVSAPGLVAHARDAGSQAPLAARLRIEGVMHADCTPWYRTDPLHGAYYRLLNPQTYPVKVRKHGYESVDTQVVVGNSLPTTVTWNLQPLPRHQLNLAFPPLEGGAGLTPERIELMDLQSDTLLSWTNPGAFSALLPQGAYELCAWIPGRIPVHQNLVLNGAQSLTLPAALQTNDTGSFTTTFPDLDFFDQSGEGCAWTMAWNDSMAFHFEDSPGLFSAPNLNCRLATNQSWMLDVPVRDAVPGALEFVEFHQLEGGRDSAFVEFSGDDGASWTTMLTLTGEGGHIVRRSVPIGLEWATRDFRFAFRVKTNTILEDSGLHLKDLRLSWNGNAVELRRPERPGALALSAWPNPFNPATTLRLTIPSEAAGSRAEVTVFDLLGRQVMALPAREGLVAGSHEFHLDASHLASGSYFARVAVTQGGREVWHDVMRLSLVK